MNPVDVTSSKFRPRSRNGQFGENKRRVGSANPLILLAWIAIALGAALNHGYYYDPSVFLVFCGSMLLVTIVAIRAPSSLWTSELIGCGLAVIAVTYAALRLPVGLYKNSGFQGDLSHTLTAVAAIGLAVAFLVLRRIPRLVAYCIIGITAWAGVATILATPTPTIDVWYMFQAAAHGLSHGDNIYRLHWFALPGEDSNVFAYLPGSALLLWPFYLVFGDVRYGELAAILLTGLLLMRVRGRQTGPLLGSLVVLYPMALFSVEQAWIDPVIVLELCAMAYSCTRGHKRLAVFVFGAALVTKQQAWLLLPLAALWPQFGWRRTVFAVGGSIVFLLPWFIASPARFWNDTFVGATHSQRRDSLSLYTAAVLHGRHPTLAFTIAATIAVVALGLWRTTRDTRGFLVGSAMVEAVFNLTGTQSYFNEWELAAGIALLAVGFSQSDSSAPAPSERGKFVVRSTANSGVP